MVLRSHHSIDVSAHASGLQEEVKQRKLAVKVCAESLVSLERPIHVLGPLVTDIALAADHITSAIGVAMAGGHGKAMLCHVTPKEHLGLPNAEDVREGQIAYKIAAHAAEIARHRTGVRDRDAELSRARYGFDWNRPFDLSLDPERAREYHHKTLPADIYKQAEFWSMCGPKHRPMQTTITDEDLTELGKVLLLQKP